MAKLTRIKPFVSDDLKLVYDTIPLLLDASPREEALCEVKGYHAAGDGVGVKSDAKTKLRVMRMSSKGIAYCLLG